MMVTVFLWTNNINVPCKPPTYVFEGNVRQKKWGQYTSKYGISTNVCVCEDNEMFREVVAAYKVLFGHVTVETVKSDVEGPEDRTWQ
jgi:hypothetical protein